MATRNMHASVALQASRGMMSSSAWHAPMLIISIATTRSVVVVGCVSPYPAQANNHFRKLYCACWALASSQSTEELRVPVDAAKAWALATEFMERASRMQTLYQRAAAQGCMLVAGHAAEGTPTVAIVVMAKCTATMYCDDAGAPDRSSPPVHASHADTHEFIQIVAQTRTAQSAGLTARQALDLELCLQDPVPRSLLPVV